MSRYIAADMSRILRKISHWVMVAIVLYFVADSSTVSTMETGFDMASMLQSMFKYMCVPCGFFAILYVFLEDFKGKTAQIAIGVGISRVQVVFAKWIETVILSAIDTFIWLFGAILASTFTNGAFTMNTIPKILLTGLMSVIATSVYIAFVMIIMIPTRGTTFALLVFIFMSTGLIAKGMGYLVLFKPIQKLHIISVLPTNLISVCRSRMILGSFAPLHWLGLIIEIALFLGITILIYRKQELEF